MSPNTGLRHDALSAKAGFQSRELIPPSLSGVYWTGRSPQRRALVEAQARESLGAPAEPAAQWLLRVEQARYAPHTAIALAQLQRELRRLPWPPSAAP